MIAHRPSTTAELAAMARALAFVSPEASRVLADRFARLFLGWRVAVPYLWSRYVRDTARLSAWTRGMLSVGFMFPVCRHRFFNELLLRSVNEGFRQVIIVGAGYDASSLRFADQLRHCLVVEIDHPATQARKMRILSGRKAGLPHGVRFLPADLQARNLSDALAPAHVKRDVKTVVIAEGVLPYLDADRVRGLLAQVAGLAGHVRLGFDYRLTHVGEEDAEPTVRKWRAGFRRRGEEYVTFYETKEAERLLQAAGFSLHEHRNLAHVWADYAPALPVPEHLRDVGAVIVGERQ